MSLTFLSSIINPERLIKMCYCVIRKKTFNEHLLDSSNYVEMFSVQKQFVSYLDFYFSWPMLITKPLILRFYV